METEDIVSVAKEKLWEASSLHCAAWRGQSEAVSVLLENGALIRKRSWVNATAIELACERGYFSIVKQLHTAGSELSQKCLHHASSEGHFDIVSYLLDNGLRDSCTPCKGKLESRPSSNYFRIIQVRTVFKLFWSKNTTLFWSTNITDEERSTTASFMFRELQSKLSINIYDDNHTLLCRTSLFAAVNKNHKNIVELLLQRSKKALYCADYSGRFPIHEAARQNNKEIMKVLMQAGASPRMTCTAPQTFQNASDILRREEIQIYESSLCRKGSSVLEVAASENGYRLIPLLVQNKVNLLSPNDLGDTALHIAACNNSLHFPYFLISLGASIEEKNKFGATPLLTALKCGAYETVNLLLSHYHSNISQVDKARNNVFHYSVMSKRKSKLYKPLGFWQLDKFLVISGVYRSASFDPDTDSLLLLASYAKLANRIDLIDSRNNLGQTALHIASRNGFEDAVNVLLQFGANASVLDKKSKLPIHYAIESCSATPLNFQPVKPIVNFNDLFLYARSHELVVGLLSNTSKLDTCNCLNNNESLLHAAIKREAFYAIRALLLKGFSTTCSCGNSKSTVNIILDYAINKGCIPNIIPSRFVPSFEIQCGLPFERSLAHQVAFYRSCCFFDKKSILFDALLDFLKELPSKNKTIDTCWDKEGYLLLHRAIQGGNVLVFRTFVKLGADVNMKGLVDIDPLDLAFGYHFRMIQLIPKGSDVLESNWEIIALDIIKKRYVKGNEKICKENSFELSVFHLAVAYGMSSLVKNFFTDSTLNWRITANCQMHLK